MLTPYQAVRTFLLGQPSITAVVAQRVFLAQIPQDAQRPLLLITQVSSTRRHSLDLHGIDMQRISIECRSSSVSDATGADTLGDLVIKALDKMRLPVATPAIELITLAGDVTFYEDSSRSVRRIVDFHCHLAS